MEENFWEKLEEKYCATSNGRIAWGQEKEQIEKLLASIEKEIEGRYLIETPINIGGAGIVIRVLDQNLGTPRALKCARPISGKEPLLNDIMASEIARLVESSHPNIISIFFRGAIDTENGLSPFYVMEYIEGAQDALEFIEKSKPPFCLIVNVIKQCVDGLIFLHAHNTIHGDIKLENILVSLDGRAKISDLGSARLLIAERENTLLTFTKDFAHPELRALFVEVYPSDPNRARAEVPRSKLKPIFDLYALGKNIFRILDKYDEISDQEKITIYQRQYLTLMAARMLDGLNDESESALSLPKYAFKEIKYKSSTEVLSDIHKITGEYAIHEAIPELDHHFPRTIQISGAAASAFTPRLANLLSLSIFRRLAGVTQLGLIIQIYPTATHSRLEHVLGTFANVARFCDALWNDPVDPLFKQLMTERDINMVLLGALFHDLGQYPLAHDLEEAENKLFSHKELGVKILSEASDILGSDNRSLDTMLSDEWRIDPTEIIEMLSAKPSDTQVPLKYRLLHSLIDGPIDADKIDYLVRDSNNLNVPYGRAIDIERLLKCLTVVFKPYPPDGLFISMGIHEKGKIPAEAVAFSRYAMFGSVYWHHTSRSIKSMLHQTVWEALEPAADRKSKEYKDLHRSFLDEVMQQIRPQKVETLFPGYLPKKLSLLKEAPQLAMTDHKMLEWIYEKTSTQGKKIIEMICIRRVFKRILVISGRKNRSLWKKLIDFRTIYDWRQLLAFQREVQSRLVRIIDLFDSGGRRMSSVMSKNKRDEIVARENAGEILFLVDIPTERRGSSYDLYFKPEVRIFGPLKSTDGNITTEDSVLWIEFAKNFLESIGKIRVFCHPDIIETCTGCLTRMEIEGVLEQACQYAIDNA